MNVCMIGDFSADLDEGYKNTSHYLAGGLERRHVVTRLNAKRVGTMGFWQRFAQASPEIIHTIAQPTDQSLVLTHLLRRYRPQARTVISALRGDQYFLNRRASLKQRLLIRLMRPDMVLTQSESVSALLRSLSCRVSRLSNGVDVERFRPVSQGRKRELRAKYGVDPDRRVVLHVGHLHPARNLLALRGLPRRGVHVVVAGSLYMGTNQAFIEQIERAGFHLLKGYQPQVEELYQLADCYVFPTRPGDSITTPLSVLEALACNLPVVTTRFSGLVEAFQGGAGLTFVDDSDDLTAAVMAALEAPAACATRELVAPFAWHSVIERLQAHYEEILSI